MKRRILDLNSKCFKNDHPSFSETHSAQMLKEKLIKGEVTDVPISVGGQPDKWGIPSMNIFSQHQQITQPPQQQQQAPHPGHPQHQAQQDNFNFLEMS